MPWTLEDFVRESNRIEGINRDPTWQEIDAHKQFLEVETVMLQDLERFVSVCQPGATLRDGAGMDVRVGKHIPIPGGPLVMEKLAHLLSFVNIGARTPHEAHIIYENLHPFTDGNGRSGRVLWLWQMGGIKSAPLGFLHHFYYQTLGASH